MFKIRASPYTLKTSDRMEMGVFLNNRPKRNEDPPTVTVSRIFNFNPVPLLKKCLP